MLPASYFTRETFAVMTHSGIVPEVFIEIAAETVKKHLAEVKAMSAGKGRLTFDELLGRLKILNSELSHKALSAIKELRGQNMNATQNLVSKYHQIISSSVNLFVKEL